LARSLREPIFFAPPFVTMSMEDLEARIAALEGNHALGGDDTLYLSAADANAFWLLFGMILVFFMQAGFAMLEVGSVQIKNTKNILIKNLFDASIAAIFWWWTGYGIAFGKDEFGSDGKNGFMGTTGFFYEGEANTSADGKTYGKAFFLFQWAFAGAAATIVSGAVAERCTFGAYLCYSAVITGFIYPVSVHMGWSGAGKLSPWRSNRLVGDCGVIDFAGSGVVHMTGGVAALVGAAIIGPRTNWKDGLGAQSVVYQTLGTLILWVGWYGFNGVSTLAITGYGGLAAHVMMTTTISAATGCLATVSLGYALDHVIDTGYANNGILAGLVSITAPCPVVNLWGAFVIGLIAAPVYLAASKAIKKAGIDDVVDAFPVHGACGAWGVLAASLFATKYYYKLGYYSDDERAEDCAGAFYGGDGGSVQAAILFILFIIVWVGGASAVMFLALKFTIGVRVSEEIEEMGMDDSKHGGNVMNTAVPKEA
jgi:Amt family ammonium transporter